MKSNISFAVFTMVLVLVLEVVASLDLATETLCVTPEVVKTSMSNKSAPFKVGDCLIPKDQSVFPSWEKSLKSSSKDKNTLAFALPKGFGFPANTFGIWELDTTCSGLKLVETQVIKSSSKNKPGKCPTGQVPVVYTNGTASGKKLTKCQVQYGEKWEQGTGTDSLSLGTTALCYPSCRKGYIGNGPVCWSACPDKYKDVGAFCQKPRSYGRGSGNWSRDYCKKHKGRKTGCEKNGALWYPKCRDGYNAVGCCVCSPKCPSGMTDIGADCAKKSYGRGAGKPMYGDTKFGLALGGMLASAMLGAAAAVF